MSDLDRLMYWRGIAEEYQNYRGESVRVPIENRLTLLEAMHVDVSSPEAVALAANELDVEPWRHFFPPMQTCRISAGESAHFYINLHPARLTRNMGWELQNDKGEVVDSGALLPNGAPEVGDYIFEGERFSRRRVSTRIVTPGYYKLTIIFDDGPFPIINGDIDPRNIVSIETTLAVAPHTVFQPAWQDKAKPWGFIVQLYTLRTESDWGIGDFSDLQLLIRKSAAMGADLIGLNPVHALLPDVETYNSPYSPSDRRFINALYIDPVSEQDYIRAASLHTEIAVESRLKALTSLREKSLVDYTAVKDLKYPVFEAMYRHFCSEELDSGSEREAAFLAFLNEGGIALQQYALYETARNRWQQAHFFADIDDQVLSAEPDSASYKAALGKYHEPVLFHCYMQWVAHCQLGACQKLAEDSGMRVGLVRDLAVGADGGGAEAFSNPQQFCRGVSIGAPPDPMAEQGQNWGLPPMDPAYLRTSGYAHFIQVLKENMSHCGALRIDHAMSLMRLWWCPPGKTANHGAYVYYPFEDMLALLCLESHLNGCAIIGEDLGVVPHEFRQAISAAGIFTNRVFYFEKENYSTFKHPENYDVHALAMVNNHDVPTLKSWWDGSDLVLRDRLDIFEEGVDYASMVEQRARDKKEVFNFLSGQKLLPESWQALDVEQIADDSLIYAILIAVSNVASKLYVIQLEDVLLMEDPVNVPGTFKEHPNWQRKLNRTIEDIFDSAATIELLSAIDSIRRNN